MIEVALAAALLAVPAARPEMPKPKVGEVWHTDKRDYFRLTSGRGSDRTKVRKHDTTVEVTFSWRDGEVLRWEVRK